MTDKDYNIVEGETYKILSSAEANYFFNKKTGFMTSWGKTIDEDVKVFPAPTLLDIEVTTKCSGVNGKVCPFCYKANTPDGENMSFETYKTILDKFPNVLTQVAFGADSTLTSNPDLWRMMEYTRSKGIVPNITAAQISEAVADQLAKYCGAVAISRYDDADACYDSVYKLTSRGMRQVNIHLMISQETLEVATRTLQDCRTDERLKNLNAVVFLSLKKKGRGIGHQSLTQEQFNSLVDLALKNNVKIGFDSCSSVKVFSCFENKPEMQFVEQSIIPCEATLESSYCDVKGQFFPCSFIEGTEGWETGIDVVSCKDFIDEVWNNPRVEEFRNALLATTVSNSTCSCRSCPYYEV